jgi:hypothetical protein
MTDTAYTLTDEEVALVRSHIGGATNIDDFWSRDEFEPLRKSVRQHCSAAQNFRCCYCRHTRVSSSGNDWDIDHVAPKAIYPQFTFEPKNLALSCSKCNELKGQKDTLGTKPKKIYPKTGKNFHVVHPHLDIYRDHIEIIDHILYVPVSDKGAWTVKECGLWRFAALQAGAEPDLDGSKVTEAIDAVQGAQDPQAKLVAALILKRQLDKFLDEHLG